MRFFYNQSSSKSNYPEMLGQIGLALGCMNYLTGAPSIPSRSNLQTTSSDFAMYQSPIPISGGSRKQIHPESGENLTSSNEKIVITARSPNKSPVLNGSSLSAIPKIPPLLNVSAETQSESKTSNNPYGYNAAANIPYAFSHQLSCKSRESVYETPEENLNVQSSIRKRAQFQKQLNKHFLFRQQKSPSPPSSNLRVKVKDAIELLSADNLRKSSFRAKGQSDCFEYEFTRNIPKSMSTFARRKPGHSGWSEKQHSNSFCGNDSCMNHHFFDLGKHSESRECLLCSQSSCECYRSSSEDLHAFNAPTTSSQIVKQAYTHSFSHALNSTCDVNEVKPKKQLLDGKDSEQQSKNLLRSKLAKGSDWKETEENRDSPNCITHALAAHVPEGRRSDPCPTVGTGFMTAQKDGTAFAANVCGGARALYSMCPLIKYERNELNSHVSCMIESFRMYPCSLECFLTLDLYIYFQM